MEISKNNFTEVKTGENGKNTGMHTNVGYMIQPYDMRQQAGFPPVNRKLKPRSSNAGKLIEELADTTLNNPITEESFTLRPPSVDRNLKPNIYKVENSSLLENVFRRCMDVKNSMETPAETDKYILKTQTLPRSVFNQSIGPTDATISHQRSLSVNHAPVKIIPTSKNLKDEPRLQYFDLDLSKPPTVNRQSININNLTKSKSKKIDSSVQDSLKSGVVYNSVDFVKTEAFKRIREEREKESENVNYDVKLNK